MAANHARDSIYADDEYDDMEDWYSSSFPRSPAESFTIKSSIVLDSDAMWVADAIIRDKEPWIKIDTGDIIRNLDTADDFGNVYEILIDEVSTSRTEPIDTVNHDENSMSCKSEVGITNLGFKESNKAVQLMNQLQPLSFKRKVQASAPLHEIGAYSCDRCKSDLNRKLMVSCSECSFRRHLYCYTPPLNQHPVFKQTQTTVRGIKVKPRVTADNIARYTCDACVETKASMKASQKVCTEQLLKLSPTNEDVRISNKTEYLITRARRISTPTVERKRAMVISKQLESGLNNVNEDLVTKQNIQHLFEHQKDPTNPHHHNEGYYRPIEWRWRCNRNNSFDWLRYRADKYAKVISSTSLSECLEDRAKQGSELIFYSDSLALLRGTTIFWKRYMAKQNLLRRRRDDIGRMTTKTFKAKVMHMLTPQDTEKLENAQLRKLQELQNDSMIFDDSLFYRFDDSSRHFEDLRRPRMTLTAQELQSESVAPFDFEREHHLQDVPGNDQIWDLCLEMSEILSMAHEDTNVWPNDSSETNNHNEIDIPSHLRLHHAARVIQTVLLQWRCRIRHALQLQRELRQMKDEQQKRRTKARRFAKVLCLCIKFIIVIFRQLRSIQVKKDLLLIVKDAADDKAALNSIEDMAEQQKLLAGNLIRRFFSRKVQPYIYLKKCVMAKRIQRFCKHKILPWKWREMAIFARNSHRGRACLRIQKVFRRFRTKMIFQRLARENAILRVRRFLRSWLFQRTIKKEKLRKQIYEAAIALGIAQDLLQICPNASISKVLYELGMVLYQLGDFWNAAWMLHQASKNDQHTLDWKGRIALAYSHHMTWYTSYDMFNLEQAHDIYCIALESISDRTSKDASSVVDPLILQDLAIVKMHKACFGSSLQLLAKLIEFFPQENGFSLWVFLAAIQLQQKGDWEQSIEYLVYLQDIAPEPYLERDILALCAIGYERTCHLNSQIASKEAWKAALRLWNLEPKKFNCGTAYITSNMTRVSAKDVRKREMLAEFAARAFHQGHYLLTCQLLIYSSTRLQMKGEDNNQQQLWWILAEAFRHLGHIDLYLSATERLSDTSTQADRKKWVENQSNNFLQEVTRIPILEKLRLLSFEYTTPQ